MTSCHRLQEIHIFFFFAGEKAKVRSKVKVGGWVGVLSLTTVVSFLGGSGF